MVNLLTLNTLRCSRKDVTEGRLTLTTSRVEVRPTSDYDAAFLQHLLPSLEWDQLVAMALVVGVTLPAELNETLRGDDAFLRALHHVLFDVQVLEGSQLQGRVSVGSRLVKVNGKNAPNHQPLRPCLE